jgi:BlaI family penicillinase repressor
LFRTKRFLPLDMEKNKSENNTPIEPTKSELEILQVIWNFGASTVRFVNDKLNEAREINYTSTLKLMQIMADKGILKRDESQMKHIYHVAQKENITKDFLLEKFIDNMYNGSAGNLMMQLLGNKKTSKEDIETIKELLKKIDTDK